METLLIMMNLIGLMQSTTMYHFSDLETMLILKKKLVPLFLLSISVFLS